MRCRVHRASPDGCGRRRRSRGVRARGARSCLRRVERKPSRPQPHCRQVAAPRASRQDVDHHAGDRDRCARRSRLRTRRRSTAVRTTRPCIPATLPPDAASFPRSLGLSRSFRTSTDDGPHFLLEEARGRDASDAPEDTRGRRRCAARAARGGGRCAGAALVALNEWDLRRQELAQPLQLPAVAAPPPPRYQRRRRSCHSARGILLVRHAVTYTPSAGLNPRYG